MSNCQPLLARVDLTSRGGAAYHTIVNFPRRIPFGPAVIFAVALLSGGLAAGQVDQDASAERVRPAIEAGRLDEAIEEAHRAAERFQQSSELHQLLGAALFKKGLNPEAREAFRRAIELDTRIPQDYLNLALVDLSEGRYPEASQ